MVQNRSGEILQKLRRTFTTPEWAAHHRDPFETLIVTVISQNTHNRNTAKAFQKLSSRFEITPKALANAETSHIEESLKVAGLYRTKAKRIREISKIVLERFQGDLEPVLSLPFEEARRILLGLPGIGPKTADVVLLFCSERPTIPVDTHVNRVSKRLGLAPEQGDYERVRESLQNLYRPEDYFLVHVLLILLGREYCKAKNPLCIQCPVDMLCPSKRI